MLLFLAFGYAKAGLVPVINTTSACNDTNGTVTITGTGVSGPFYIWVSGGAYTRADSNVIASATFTGLAPGPYQYYIYCSSGTQQGNFTITPVDHLVLTTAQPVCPNGTTGTAVANVSNGTPPYTYTWSTGATTSTVTNLPLGLNWVSVTDANGCSTMAEDTVQITSSVVCTIGQTGPPCNGTLTATATGGVTPYSYSWGNGATTESISGLVNGNYYFVTITDADGCQGVNYTYINNTSLAFDSVHTQVIQPTCGNNGSIYVVMENGTAPYTYVWSNGATGATITGLGSNDYSVSGDYSVTVTDANGCSGTNYYYLYGNAFGEFNYPVNPGCGLSNGSITVNAYGGTTPYAYSWSNGTSHNAIDSLLPAGTYHYTVTDASGCAITDSAVLIPQGNFTAQVNVSNIICPATTGGSMTVTVTGTGPYTYLWSNGATTQTISNLTEGSYFTVTATDPGGCQAVAWSDSVGITAPFTVALSSVGCSSTVTASVTGGGTAPYTFLWSNGETTATITYSLYVSYSLTVTDAHGCSAYQYFYQYTTGIQLDSTGSVTYPTCTTLGSIIANPLNGSAPFTYLWSNGATTGTITGLQAGSYQVTVTDANGCTGAGYYYLSENSVYVYSSNSSFVCGTSTGSVTLNTSGGTPPYNYTWSNTNTNHTGTQTSLPAGTYSYTVTDAGGCSATGTDVLTAPGSFLVSAATTPTSCNPNTPTGAVNVTVSNGGTAPFTFSWQLWNGQTYTYPVTNSGLSGLAYGDGVWLLSATDANGCNDSAIVFTGTDTAGTYINYAASCYDDITGYAFTDLNSNCTKGPGDPGIANVIVVATDNYGNYYYANTDSNGFYDIQVLPGTYIVTAYSYGYGYGSCNSTPCTSSYSPTLSGTGVVSPGNNFGYSNTPSFDLVVHTGYLPSVPGSQKEYWVYYYNQGTQPANNVVLTFVHDPNLTLTSTNPPYTSYNPSTHTIVWNLGTVPVSWLGTNQQVTMEFNVPSNLPLGTLLSAYDSITPITGDCNPANNVQFLSDLVTGSHDPNVKEVSPSGNITASDSVLNYTIRFQNTGNAPARKVIIIDTLSRLVNPASFVPGAASSKYTYTLSGNGIITFTFDPIYLPDSAQSVDSSQGFVMYSVNIRNTDAIGSQVKNTAYIYFDLNPAVVTNTTLSTLSFPENIKQLTAGGMSIAVTPNPVHDKSLFSIDGATGEVLFEVTDITGQKIFETSTTDRNIIFESETFAAGVYIYSARDIKGNTCTGKVVIVH